jgi:hypothetical protein
MRTLKAAKWFVLPALILAGIATSANAAIIRNGFSYSQYVVAAGAKCPDGNNPVRHSAKTWCRTYAATLRWAIPNTRENGQPLQLSELSGYEIYWTRDRDSSSGTIAVKGGQVATQKFETFVPATYYFAMSAVDSKGLKSKLSSMINTPLR